jgi:hypothetical protein
MKIRGVGGSSETQFQISQPATIRRPASLAPDQATLRATGNQNKLLEDVFVDGGNGTAIWLDDSPNTILRQVGSSTGANAPQGIGLRINNSYWVWAYDCVFKARQGQTASILIERLPAQNGVGNINFYGLRCSGSPIVFRDSLGKPLGQITIQDATMETPDRCFVLVDELAYLQHLYLKNCHMADAGWFGDPTTTGFIDIRGGIKQLTVAGLRGISEAPQMFPNKLPDSLSHLDSGAPKRWSLTKHPNGQIVQDGELETTLAMRGQNEPIVSMRCPAVSMRPVAQWAVGAGITLTPGQPGPCGDNAAVLVERGDLAGQSSALWINDRVNLEPSEPLILGLWIKQTTPAPDDFAHMAPHPFFIGISSAQGWTLEDGSGGFWSEMLRQQGNGWLPLVRLTKAWPNESTSHTNPIVQIGLRMRANNRFLVWRPFVLRPGFDRTPRELAAILRTVTRWAPDIAIGHCGTEEDVTFKSGRGPARPDAAVVGAGAQWYDTALGLPLWSDGEVWRSATGEAV